ncbi:hypothetical protein [Rhodococcus globerulus]|uniref:hypothetical protein n=1 Tax=Rhodococcus globerulus TaxID=33008 RepID=UPI003017C4AC
MNSTNETAGVVELPEGCDVESSFWRVSPTLRADYVSLSAADLSSRERKDLRQRLASHLYNEAAEAWRADSLSAYMRKHNVGKGEALRYMAGFDGRITIDVTTSMELHARFDVGTGSEWPTDSESRIEHLWRLEQSTRIVQQRASLATSNAARTCPMCKQIPAELAQTRVTARTPAAGLPSVRVCGVCADVIGHLHAERAANAVVDAGKSRRDLAAEYLAANDPNAAAPVIRTGADLLAAAGRTAGR